MPGGANRTVLLGAILVTGSERSGDDVIVSFDALFAPPGGGEPVPVPPRRKVRLRRSGETWALMTHDVLAIGLLSRILARGLVSDFGRWNRISSRWVDPLGPVSPAGPRDITLSVAP